MAIVGNKIGDFMKKINSVLRVILFLSLILATSICVACSSNNTDNDEIDKAILTLNYSELTINEYETKFLNATKINLEDDIVWSSSEPSVATVNEVGMISAVSTGQTIITATAGQKSVNCIVMVVKSFVEPTIEVNYNSINIKDGSSIKLKSTVKWQNEIIEDGVEFCYFVGDGQIVSLEVLNELGKCNLTGLKNGETTVTVKAIVRGKTAYKVVPVFVQQEEIVFDIENNDYKILNDAYAIDISTVSIYDNINNTIPKFSATYKGQAIEDFNIIWQTEDVDIITIDENGKITAKATGEAIVTGKYYFETLDKEYFFTICVNVYKPEINLGSHTFYLNRNDAIIDFSTAETSAKMIVDKEQTDIRIENGAIFLNTDILKRTVENKIVIETETLILNCNVTIEDYAISTAEEFFDWYKNGIVGTYSSAFLTQNIVLPEDGETIANGQDVYWSFNNNNESFAYNGTFDGKGYAIANFKSTHGFMPTLGVKGVIKNLALINMTTTGDFGFLGFIAKTGATIENCYFQGEQTSKNGGDFFSGAYTRYTAGANFTNVVINVDRSASGENGANDYAFYGDSRGWNTKLTNVYMVNNNCRGDLFGDNNTNWKTSNANLYASAIEMKSEISSVPTAFSVETWTISNGVLVMKSVVDYYEKNPLKVVEIEEIFIGVGVKLKSNMKNVNWTVQLDSNQYTIVNDILTIVDNSLIGSQIIVTASVTSLDEVYLGEVTYSVNEVMETYDVIQLDNVVVGLNSNKGVTLEVEQPYDVFVFIDDVKQSGTFTIHDNELLISKEYFANTIGARNVTVQLLNQGKIELAYTLNVEVVDYAIGSQEELYDWFANGFKNKATTVVLTNDIILDGVYFDNKSVFSAYNADTESFKGTFDGRGYTIANFNAWYGFFGFTGSNSTFKNLALVNMTICGRDGYLGCKHSGTLENIYIQGQHVNASGSTAGTAAVAGFTRYTSSGKFTNVVMNVDRSGLTDAAKTYALFNSNTSNNTSWNNVVENVYIVANNTNGNLIGTNGADKSWKMTDVYLYETLKEMQGAVSSVPSDFSTDMWTYDATYGLIMNGALKYLERNS